MKHLILFDGECPLCQNMVRRIYALDKNKAFFFAPLQGKTSKQFFKESHQQMLEKNTLILIENYLKPSHRLWIYGRAVCRIFWLIGGKWKMISWLCFLPVGVNVFYRFIARHRHLLSENASSPLPEDRILP
jgi:predicted DCC family thiol-disulfide oxidoreductase YuxK